MAFWVAAAPMLAQAGMSLAQQHIAGQQAKRDEKRREEQAKQDKLLAAFGQQPSQQPQQYSQPSGIQKILSDPITQQLVSGLADKAGGRLDKWNKPPQHLHPSQYDTSSWGVR